MSKQMFGEKVSRTLTPQFDFIVCTIGESQVGTTVKIEDLHGNLKLVKWSWQKEVVRWKNHKGKGEMAGGEGEREELEEQGKS